MIKLLQKLFQIGYCIYALLLFVFFLLIIFPFALVASIFGRIKGGNFIYRICVFCVDLMFLLTFIRHRNSYEQPIEKNRQYIYVGNHISYLDAILILKTIRNPIRVLGRIELSNLPIFGFIYRNVVVIVDRSDAEHRAKSVRNLVSIISKGVSILVMPEGTFNMSNKPLKDFYDGAFRVAIETQTPIKPFLLLDAYDRMNYRSLFTLNPGKSRSVFLEEISVEGYRMDDIAALKQKVYSIMENKLKEYKASWIEN